jgi:hypothetical protein
MYRRARSPTTRGGAAVRMYLRQHAQEIDHPHKNRNTVDLSP